MERKKILPFVLVCILVLQVFVLSAPLTVSAAGKNGLQVVGGKMYYHEDGKVVTDQWVYAGGHYYYFGKSGAAYRGRKKVGKNWYYFDKKCQRVENRAVRVNGKRFYFLGDGKAAKKTTCINGKIWKVSKVGRMLKNINGMAKRGKDLDAFIRAAGKPKKVKRADSCIGPGKDGTYLYDTFTIYTYEENGVRKITEVSRMAQQPIIYG